MLKKPLLPLLAFALFALAALLTNTYPARSAPLTAPLRQIDMPVEGWVVCFVGGMEPIPGIGDRQVFEVCNGDFWRVSAYCQNPGVPAPSQGAVCSLVNGESFFCGASVQSLGLYAILQTPGPATETPTLTVTATVTLTPTPTRTPTQLTPALDTQVVDTLTPTPYDRPRAGGPGNLGFVAGGLAALGVSLGLGLFLLLRQG